MKKKFIKYSKALDFIQDADILLYSNKSLVSFFIQRFGEGQYSHIGLASWHTSNGYKILETVEFREGKGGRVISLENYINKYSGLIDVYRPAPEITKIYFDGIKIQEEKIQLQPKLILNNMRKMSGLPYGWKRIWWIAKHKMLGFRLLYNMQRLTDDSYATNNVYPVCSTAAASSFALSGYDIIQCKSNEFTEPSDFAKSGITNYLFTLVKD